MSSGSGAVGLRADGPVPRYAMRHVRKAYRLWLNGLRICTGCRQEKAGYEQ